MAEPPEGFTIRDAQNTLAAEPSQWQGLRGWTRDLFNSLAPDWENNLGPHHDQLLDAALAQLPAPRVAIDLGTGTGVGARAIARHFPDAAVVGVDIAEQMVRAAAAKPHPDRVGFALADGARLPFADGSVDLVLGVNVFWFFDEVARVVAPGGRIAVLYSRGEDTPIFLPAEQVHEQLRTAGFGEVSTGRAAIGVMHLAQRP